VSGQYGRRDETCPVSTGGRGAARAHLVKVHGPDDGAQVVVELVRPRLVPPTPRTPDSDPKRNTTNPPTRMHPKRRSL